MKVATQELNSDVERDFRFMNAEALIIKVTKRCNLDCAYCYENIAKNGDMDIQIFKNLASKAFFSSNKKKIQFILHGGEPTLLSDKFYTEAFALCKKLAARTGKELSLSIQTNLIRLTDD